MKKNTLNKYTYHPMHMHLHAGCDYGSSMALAMSNAKKLGMNYIWFTDHDTRMGIRENAITEFSFDTSELLKTNSKGFYGFRTISDTTSYKIDTASETLEIFAKSDNISDWNTSGVCFESKGTLHTYALAGGVTLSIDLKEFNLTPDTRLIFAVKLSQRPDKLENAYILYVVGESEDIKGTHYQVIPLENKNGVVTLPISEDVSEIMEIGGKDNAFDTIYIVAQSRNGMIASAKIGDFKIHREKSAEELRKELQKAADKVGEQYGVTPFVSFEISAAGEHKNCYSTDVPVIDYRKNNYSVSEEEAINHVKKYGGIFAVNHPFATTKFKGKQDIDEQSKIKMFKDLFSELFLNNALDASLIEVGFPEGRLFSLDYYLYLWDMLSLSGIFLAGDGSSDSHRNNNNWFEGNNFATYIGVDSSLSYPISVEEFIDAMKKRRVYTADPTAIKGEVIFETVDGQPMGTIISASEDEMVSVRFSADKTCPGWEFRLVENGVYVHSQIIEDNNFTYTSKFSRGNKPVSFQRVELWNEKGRCILISNPIYLVDYNFSNSNIPKGR